MNQLINSLSSTPMSVSEFQSALKGALAVNVKSRPYTAQITRDSPSAFIFLIDQSGSMDQSISFRGEQTSKADVVAAIVNETLREILNRCQKPDSVRDYFDIALLGYGGSSKKAQFAWSGDLEGKKFVKPSELKQFYLTEEEIVTEKIVRGMVVSSTKTIKTWLEPVANGLTPMNDALQTAASLLEEWIVLHRGKDIFPPIVINITDGEATDAKEPELLESAMRIKRLRTSDGNVLFLNIHLSNAGDEPVLFPKGLDMLPNDKYAELLFNMSSEMPSRFNDEIANINMIDSTGNYVGLAFNADANKLIQMMQIGTNTPLSQVSPGND
jgi:hypothetical protein